MLAEKVVHIDSSHRNRDVYPHASHYDVTLPGDPGYQRAVCGLKLLSATFPKTQPVFTDRNRYLDIETAQSADIITLEIPRGNYGIADVIDYLNTTYEMVYCRVVVPTGVFVIGSASDDNPVRLRFGTGPNRHRSAHSVLGFPSLDTPEFATEQFGVMHANLDSSPFVDVLVDELPSVAHQQTPDGPVLARVPLDNPNFTTKYWLNEMQHDPGYRGASLFHPIYLPRLTVRLRNAHGDAYDTFGFDHLLTFRMVYMAPDLPLSLAPPPYASLKDFPLTTDDAHARDTTPPSPPHSTKHVVRNSLIGLGVLGGACWAITRMGPSKPTAVMTGLCS